MTALLLNSPYWLIVILALGTTGTLYRTLYGASGAALTLATSAPLRIPLLSLLPLVGEDLQAGTEVVHRGREGEGPYDID